MKISELKKKITLNTLKKSKSMREACEKLGVSPRTLRNWLHKWDEMGLLDKNFKRTKKDKVYDCMRNLTPKERDFIYNRNTNIKIPEWINN